MSRGPSMAPLASTLVGTGTIRQRCNLSFSPQVGSSSTNSSTLRFLVPTQKLWSLFWPPLASIFIFLANFLNIKKQKTKTKKKKNSLIHRRAALTFDVTNRAKEQPETFNRQKRRNIIKKILKKTNPKLNGGQRTRCLASFLSVSLSFLLHHWIYVFLFIISSSSSSSSFVCVSFILFGWWPFKEAPKQKVNGETQQNWLLSLNSFKRTSLCLHHRFAGFRQFKDSMDGTGRINYRSSIDLIIFFLFWSGAIECYRRKDRRLGPLGRSQHSAPTQWNSYSYDPFLRFLFSSLSPLLF